MAKVLIIEENQRVAHILSSYLQKKGHEVEIAADGISAIRAFVGEKFGLLLVNLELPFMSGDAVCRKIRETSRGKDLPIVMMSGELKDEAEIEKLKRELSLHGFLAKPFTSVLLSNVLTKVLPHENTAAPSASVQQPVPEPAPPIEQQQASPPPRRESAPAAPRPAAMEGDLERTPFEKVLLYLHKKKGTGALTAAREDQRRIFHFIHGALIEAETPPGEDDFGRYLQKKGLAEEVELRQYREARSQGDDPRDLFVKMGCLAPEQLQHENRLFVLELLGDCFTWTRGLVVFDWATTFLPELSSASIWVPVLFYHGFKAKVTPGMSSEFLEEKGRLYVARTGEFYDYQNQLAQEPGVSAVLDQIDSRKTCYDIITTSDPDKAAVILYTLDYLKALSFSELPTGAEAPPPFPLRDRTLRHAAREQEAFEDLGGALNDIRDEVAALASMKPSGAGPAQDGAGLGLSGLEDDLKAQWESIKNKNYYEIFGLKQSTYTFEKCKKAYFDLTRKYGPDKFFASSSEIMSLAEEFLSKVSNAYETLSNVVSKENYDDMLSQQEQAPSATDDKEFYLQIQFQSGKVFVEQGQYESAEKAFQNCVNAEPDKPEYMAYLALAIYNNPSNKADPAARKRAKDLVNKSLQLGKLSIAYALKGNIYLDEGGINFAEAEFNKALKLNPNNKTALKMLEQIKAKKEEDKKWRIQKMFK